MTTCPDVERPTPHVLLASVPTLRVWLASSIVLATGLLVAMTAVGVAYDRHLVEKIATRLVMPCGIVWILLADSALACWWSGMRRPAWSLALIWLVFTLGGSSLVSQQTIGSIERAFVRPDLTTMEPLEAIIVLGGGTQTNARGDVWLGNAGERLNYAAILYHAGKAKRLITTGRPYEWSKYRDRTLSSATSQLWQAVGIPEEVITQIGGRNTSEEMQELRNWVLTNGPTSRVGVITSAYHLPRALRLARRHGLDLIPLPADFQLRDGEPWPLALIPNSQGFSDTELSLKERIAGWVAR